MKNKSGSGLRNFPAVSHRGGMKSSKFIRDTEAGRKIAKEWSLPPRPKR